MTVIVHDISSRLMREIERARQWLRDYAPESMTDRRTCRLKAGPGLQMARFIQRVPRRQACWTSDLGFEFQSSQPASTVLSSVSLCRVTSSWI